MWQSICKFFYAFSHYLLVSHSLLIKKYLLGPYNTRDTGNTTEKQMISTPGTIYSIGEIET